MHDLTIPKYSLSEELINSISHGIGAVLSIVALIMCVAKSSTMDSLVSSIFYASFMIMLYTVSCIYHALSPKFILKKVMRIVDHSLVIFMVLGTYLPICFSLLSGKTISNILIVILYIVSVIYITCNLINLEKFKFILLVCNVIIGWGILLLVNNIYNLCGGGAVFLLVFGGILYSIGAILYAIGAKVKYMHSLFHFFVLAGSLFHFMFIYSYCI